MDTELRERGRELERENLERIETHISLVFLGSRSVLKVKKPVNLGFLDFTSVEARKQACEAEVRLNRRLTRDVYLGVVPVIVEEGRFPRVALDEQAANDWGVLMQRLPAEDSLQSRLERGAFAPRMLDELAALLADFHSQVSLGTGREASAAGDPSAIEVNVCENFAQAHDLLCGVVNEAQQREVEDFQLSWLRQHADLFRDRVAQGRIVDGHGDLRLEHVYADESGALTVIDCIEFNERFRLGDACADVAFLSMDLCYRSRTDLAERFLARYAEASGDFELYRVVDFYQSYRAYVRAKVCELTASGSGHSAAERQQLEAQARRFFLLSQASERPPLRRPQVVALGGLIASGKSTVGRALGRTLGIPVVSSDRTRKRLFGVGPADSLLAKPFEGAYGKEASRRVYKEIFRLAAAPLASGRTVILDASFSSRAQREAAKAFASEHGVGFRFVECCVPEEVARERLRKRASGPSESDGREEHYAELAAKYDPVDELPADEVLRLNTTGAPDLAVRSALDWLEG